MTSENPRGAKTSDAEPLSPEKNRRQGPSSAFHYTPTSVRSSPLRRQGIGDHGSSPHPPGPPPPRRSTRSRQLPPDGSRPGPAGRRLPPPSLLSLASFRGGPLATGGLLGPGALQRQPRLGGKPSATSWSITPPCGASRRNGLTSTTRPCPAKATPSTTFRTPRPGPERPSS